MRSTSVSPSANPNVLVSPSGNLNISTILTGTDLTATCADSVLQIEKVDQTRIPTQIQGKGYILNSFYSHFMYQPEIVFKSTYDF